MNISGGWCFDEAGQGFPLVLLHGLGASSFSWRHNLAPLSRHFRVLAPDLPGHGQTPASLGGDFRLETLVQGVAHFLDRQRVEQAALAGNSLGGGLALLLARQYPERFPALALLAPAAALHRLPPVFALLALPGMGLLAAALLGPWILPYALRLAYHRQELVTPTEIAGYSPTFRPWANRRALRQICRQVCHWPPSRIETLLPEIRQPTALIWGAQDRILPVPQAFWLKDRLPQAEMRLLPEVGHAPQEEAPETVNKIIIAFLERSLKN
ncbi:MAG: alpha/beta fold hydrolase [Thermodesulfobacteriota bacterium]